MGDNDQFDYWNGEAGRKWVENADKLDLLLAPFVNEIISRAALKPGDGVADIGCGSGALTRAVKTQVGKAGMVSGVDISEPLLALARRRAQDAALEITFEAGDASEVRFPHALDTVVSRFGVMFFQDPIAAFRSIRGSVSAGGRLVFVCWQAPALNDWVSLPVAITKRHLSREMEAPDPHAPGPFAFHDPARVSAILDAAGFSDVVLEDWHGDLHIPGGSPEDAAAFLMNIGPASRLVADYGGDEALIFRDMVEALAAHSKAGAVQLGAKAWIVTARRV